ncbi:DsbA family protein [Mesobacterium pallidum]|uniref:DsbA family protein n=1 Tax=Mesobacterium pallidum TaxID=2872037 RepID=UPI001EE1717D|nr:DsbA family protein [Mesobacterium pallidum]
MTFRPLLLAAGLALSATAAAAFDVEAMSAAERDAFRAEIRAYLLDNPEVIMEAVQVLEQRDAQAQAANDQTLVQVNAEALFDDGFSWVGGNPEGDVTVVEFLDYRCGYCRKAQPELEELVESDGNIRLIIKEFPILGPDSLTSSRFAIAVKQVAGDEAYASVHDALMALNGEVSEPALRRLASTLGLDADAIIARMESDEVTQVIAETRALGQRMQISGTPTFIMGDQMLRGYAPLEAMRQMIDAAREG